MESLLFTKDLTFFYVMIFCNLQIKNNNKQAWHGMAKCFWDFEQREKKCFWITTTTSKHGVALLKDIHVFKHLSKWKKNVFIMIRKNTESISISVAISWYWASILIFVYIARKKVHYWYLKDKRILYDT